VDLLFWITHLCPSVSRRHCVLGTACRNP